MDDMSSMMDSMGGMDMSSSNLFRQVNQPLDELFWYIVAGVVALGFIVRILSATDTILRSAIHLLTLTYPYEEC